MQLAFVESSLIRWSANNPDHGIRAMTESRKRSREDTSCDSMPLAKKGKDHGQPQNNPQPGNGNMQTPGQCSANSNNVISPPYPSAESDRTPVYDPGRDLLQSNYYNNNKLLFELHLERIQRTGQEFPF